MDQYTSDFRGGTTPGDIRFFPQQAGAPLQSIGGTKWLATGNLLAYSASYSRLIAAFPGLGVMSLGTKTALSSFTDSATDPRVFFTGSNYTLVDCGGSAGNAGVRYSSSLASMATSPTGLTSLTPRAAVKHGSGRLLVVGTDTTNRGIYSSTDGAAFTAATTGPSTTADVKAVESDGTTAVAALASATNTSASAFFTSTDGATWTAHTGSGGNTFSALYGIHKSPALGAFLFIGATSGSAPVINSTTDGFTQTGLTLPAGCANFLNNVEAGYAHHVASSATATLVMCSDGRLLKITAGPTLSLIDLTTLGLPATPSGAQINRLYYDGTRFVLVLGNPGSGRPTFLYSTDDGVTWTPSWCFADPSAGASSPNAGAPRLSYANSKAIWVSATSSVINALYDVTGMFATATPDYVGTLQSNISSDGSGTTGLILQAHVRIQ